MIYAIIIDFAISAVDICTALLVKEKERHDDVATSVTYIEASRYSISASDAEALQKSVMS